MVAESGSTSIEPPAYLVVDHTADWALRVFGRDMAGLLTNAALGMSSLLVADLADVPLVEERRLELEAWDAETLLVDWLSELAYLAESEGLVFREFELSQVSGTRMTAVIRGGRAAELLKHIKAVTYHNLVIEQSDQGLEATIVFDV
jgi:SHS2 domain-containing protein